MLVKRKTKTGSNALNTVYRPCKIDELLGNETNKQILKNHLDNGTLSHTLLFSGIAGCGKTTAARILALSLNCETTPGIEPCLVCASCNNILEGSSIDVVEINVGKEGGKGDIAEAVKDLAFAPFTSNYKILIFDEAHKLTAAAQDLLLKEIEDGYAHVYFIFCTNQPEALKSKKKGGDAFLGRCSRMAFEPLPEKTMYDMLNNVVEFEGEEFNTDIITYIAENTKGVPRDALVILNDVIAEGSWDIAVVKNLMGSIIDEEDAQIIELCRALSAAKWKESCKVYDVLTKTYGPEPVRIAVAGYFTSCLKKSTKMGSALKFSNILDHLVDPIYQPGKPGEYVFYNKMFKVVDIITKYNDKHQRR